MVGARGAASEIFVKGQIEWSQRPYGLANMGKNVVPDFVECADQEIVAHLASSDPLCFGRNVLPVVPTMRDEIVGLGSVDYLEPAKTTLEYPAPAGVSPRLRMPRHAKYSDHTTDESRLHVEL